MPYSGVGESRLEGKLLPVREANSDGALGCQLTKPKVWDMMIFQVCEEAQSHIA